AQGAPQLPGAPQDQGALDMGKKSSLWRAGSCYLYPVRLGCLGMEAWNSKLQWYRNKSCSHPCLCGRQTGLRDWGPHAFYLQQVQQRARSRGASERGGPRNAELPETSGGRGSTKDEGSRLVLALVLGLALL
ncbi:unnamed protein product, partial [Prorocentrum cordatum]